MLTYQYFLYEIMPEYNEAYNLGFYLNRAFSGLIERMNRELKKEGLPLNHSQFSILQAISRNKERVVSQRKIAIILGKDPAAISRSLNHLEKEGLIKKTSVSGCKNGILLTERFHEMKSPIEEVIKRVTSSACIAMSDEQITIGLQFLKKLIENNSAILYHNSVNH